MHKKGRVLLGAIGYSFIIKSKLFFGPDFLCEIHHGQNAFSLIQIDLKTAEVIRPEIFIALKTVEGAEQRARQ
jgi:hypothetical protein